MVKRHKQILIFDVGAGNSLLIGGNTEGIGIVNSNGGLIEFWPYTKFEKEFTIKNPIHQYFSDLKKERYSLFTEYTRGVIYKNNTTHIYDGFDANIEMFNIETTHVFFTEKFEEKYYGK